MFGMLEPLAHSNSKEEPFKTTNSGNLFYYLQRCWTLFSIPKPPEQREALLSAASNVGRYACEMFLNAIAGKSLLLYSCEMRFVHCLRCSESF